jgi:integrase
VTVERHQGKWRYDFRKDGVRHRKSGFATKQEARSEEVEARKRIGKISTDFLKLCTSRLEDLEIRRTTKYFKNNKALFKKLIALWGKKKEITRDDVEQYLNSVSAIGSGAANYHLRLIKGLFNHGIDREWFSYNPAGKIKPFPVDRKKKYVPPIEDILKVLDAAKPLDRLYLLVSIHTVSRIGEINKLRWEDVHEEYLILRTRKCKNSDIKERIIPLNDTIKEIMEQVPKKGEFVFINPWTKKGYVYRDKFLDTLCKKTGVKRFTFHCLRHLGASVMADEGEALTTIQNILGHERATTTDIYLRSLNKSVIAATKKLEGIK